MGAVAHALLLRDVTNVMSIKAGASMMQTDVDTLPQSGIMNPDEVAQFFQKSTSWVYKNRKILGGVKLGGSLFFPSKEDLYERIFNKKQGMEVRLHPEGDSAHRGRVQDQKRCPQGRSTKKGGGKQSAACIGTADRHNLLGTG